MKQAGAATLTLRSRDTASNRANPLPSSLKPWAQASASVHGGCVALQAFQLCARIPRPNILKGIGQSIPCVHSLNRFGRPKSHKLAPFQHGRRTDTPRVARAFCASTFFSRQRSTHFFDTPGRGWSRETAGPGAHICSCTRQRDSFVVNSGD